MRKVSGETGRRRRIRRVAGVVSVARIGVAPVRRGRAAQSAFRRANSGLRAGGRVCDESDVLDGLLFAVFPDVKILGAEVAHGAGLVGDHGIHQHLARFGADDHGLVLREGQRGAE